MEKLIEKISPELQKLEKKDQTKALNRMSDQDYNTFMQSIADLYLIVKVFDSSKVS